MYIFWQKCTIAFRRYDEIAGGLTQPAHHRMAVSLMFFFFYKPCLGLSDFIFGISECVVIDDYHFIDNPRIKKPIDDGANTARLVISRDDDTDGFTLMHGYKLP